MSTSFYGSQTTIPSTSTSAGKLQALTAIDTIKTIRSPYAQHGKAGALASSRGPESGITTASIDGKASGCLPELWTGERRQTQIALLHGLRSNVLRLLT
jgi:hypothetical protein